MSASFAAAQFALILTNVGQQPRSLALDVALYAAAAALPLLIAVWMIARSAARNPGMMRLAKTVAIGGALIGFAAFIATLAHVNVAAAIVLGVSGAVGFLLAFWFEDSSEDAVAGRKPKSGS